MQREPVDRETEARAGPWVLRVGVTLRTRLFAPRPAPHFTDGEAEAEGWHLGEAKHVLQGPGLPALLGFEPEAVPRTGSRGQTIGAACAPRPPGSHHGCRFLTPEVAPPHRERPCPWTWQEAPGGTPRCGDWGGGGHHSLGSPLRVSEILLGKRQHRAWWGSQPVLPTISRASPDGGTLQGAGARRASPTTRPPPSPPPPDPVKPDSTQPQVNAPRLSGCPPPPTPSTSHSLHMLSGPIP